MQKFQLLIVDDEWQMRNLLRIYLVKNGFEVKEANNGHEALKMVEEDSFDLILLDIMMPDMDGWEVCAEIRENKQIPILMLTARSETKDKIHGLNIGADDYLVKPFEPDELVARVFALLRRSNLSEELNIQSKKIIFQDTIVIDPEGRQVYILDKPIDLTPKEFTLMYVLTDRPGQVFSRDILLEQVWGHEYFGDERTVDTHVKNIREKARKAGLTYNPIRTIWGVGYQFQRSEERK